MEYFENLRYKENPKNPALNGHISKNRTNSESKPKFSESSFNFLQSSVNFFAFYLHGYTTEGTGLYITGVAVRSSQASKG